MLRRRIYLINKSVQLRYMAMVAILMILLAISTAWMTCATTWQELITKFEGNAVLLGSCFENVNAMLLTRLSLLILGGICLGAVVTLFAVHRIAGPLFRVKRVMGSIGQGMVPGDIKFRPKDEFNDLAAAINTAISKIREYRQSSEHFSAEAEGSLKRAKEYLEKGTPDTASALKEIESVVGKMQNLEVFRSPAGTEG